MLCCILPISYQAEYPRSVLNYSLLSGADKELAGNQLDTLVHVETPDFRYCGLVLLLPSFQASIHYQYLTTTSSSNWLLSLRKLKAGGKQQTSPAKIIPSPIMDPLSITMASFAISKTYLTVALDFKNLLVSTKTVNDTINALFLEVEAFGRTLRLMDNTFKDPKIGDSLASSGHIGNHWTSLAIVLQDAEKVLSNLLDAVLEVNTSTKVLDSLRKQFRLQGAEAKIQLYRTQICSYREIIQVSLQTALL